MIESLIYLIIVLIIAGVVIWGARSILAVIPMDPTIKRVVDVLIVVIMVVIVLVVLLRLVGMIPSTMRL